MYLMNDGHQVWMTNSIYGWKVLSLDFTRNEYRMLLMVPLLLNNMNVLERDLTSDLSGFKEEPGK